MATGTTAFSWLAVQRQPFVCRAKSRAHFALVSNRKGLAMAMAGEREAMEATGSTRPH